MVGCPLVTRQQVTAEAGDVAAAPDEEKENPLEFSSGCSAKYFPFPFSYSGLDSSSVSWRMRGASFSRSFW